MTTIDPELRSALLRRMFASRHFAHAESLRRILQYLAQRHDAEAAPKEYNIAVEAMGRPASFDPKSDPVVRVSVAQIRERLRMYFEDEGRDESLRLLLPKGQYRPAFVPAPAPGGAAAAPTSPLVRFRAPYLTGTAATMLVFSEMLFFRNAAGTFVRNIYVNELPGAAEELGRRTGLDATGYSPSDHFVSAGEMHALLAIAKVLMAHAYPFPTQNARFSSWATLRSANRILFGSSRTNTSLGSLQTGA